MIMMSIWNDDNGVGDENVRDSDNDYKHDDH